jgi:hypothetical protein
MNDCWMCQDTGMVERYPVTDAEKDRWGYDVLMPLPCRACEKGERMSREEAALQ